MKKFICYSVLLILTIGSTFLLNSSFPIEVDLITPINVIQVNFWLGLGLLLGLIYIIFTLNSIWNFIKCICRSILGFVSKALPLSHKEKKDIIMSELFGINNISLKNEKKDKLNAVWKKAGKFKYDTDFTTTYCKMLLSIDQDSEVDKIIHDYIDTSHPKEWISIYSKVKHSNVDPEQRFKWAEKVCSKKLGDPDIMNSLANLAIAASLWSKAREYIDNSLKVKNDNFDTLVCKADLYYSLGQESQALETYKQAVDVSKKISN